MQRLHTDATINEVIPLKSFLSAIRRQSVDHSELSQTALTVLKKLHFRTVLHDSEELLHLWLRL